MNQLNDGIFAIVMTLLVLEIKVPVFDKIITNQELNYALWDSVPLFLAYLLSFAVLFTYWRAHHFIISDLAKNIDIELTGGNAIFLFFVALTPFSAHLLGSYPYTQTAIGMFGINVITIGVSLYWMRHHILTSHKIENVEYTGRQIRNGNFRILLPVFCAIIAFYISFLSIQLSLTILTVAVLYNLLPISSKINNVVLDKVWPVKENNPLF